MGAEHGGDVMYPQNEPNYGTPALGPATGFTIDRKALTVAGIAMGITLALSLLEMAVSAIFGGAGSIIMLLLLAAGGYVAYQQRNPEQAQALQARFQQLTRDGLAAANHAVTAPPSPNPASTGAIVSAVLLIPTLIAYTWRYKDTGFTDVWQPWWILTALNLYFVVCVATRSRHPGKAPLAVLLGLAGTALIALANNPSDDVNLIKMFSSKRYYDGDYYPVLPSADVMLWISRTPILAVLLFVAAWGVARRRQSGWVLGMIPAALLVWWAIYGSEHPWAWQGDWQGGWFQPWVLSVGTFIGGCLCCWLADLLTSGGSAIPAGMPYAPPAWPSPASPPVPPPVPPVVGPPPAHADYRAQASQHFQGHHPGGPGGMR